MPKATPASVAAHSIASRASWSDASATARTSDAPVRRSASREPRSLQGLAPWLIGRAVAGVGGRRVKGRAVYDSSACERTSKPLAATTFFGRV